MADALQEIAAWFGGPYSDSQIVTLSATDTGHPPQNSTSGAHPGLAEPSPQATTATMTTSCDASGSCSKYTWSPTTSSLIIDVEGFKVNKDFYVKEMAFYNAVTKEHWVGTFKPPFDKQCMKKGFASNIDLYAQARTGLTWEEGSYPYNVAFTMLSYFGNSHQLYASGRDMCQWIQQHTSLSVVDLEELGCPNVKEVPFGSYCVYHNSLKKRTCALAKAIRMGYYLMDMFSLKTLPLHSFQPDGSNEIAPDVNDTS